jgi:hypothetical protein
MKIIYIVYNDWSRKQRDILAEFGINAASGYSRIEVEETSNNEKLLKMIDEWKLSKSVGTSFDANDLRKSNIFLFEGSWPNGYPQPEDNFGYMDVTYDTSKYCRTCGIGAYQNASFQIKQEPKWGKRKMFELNWVLDEIFVRKDLYVELFEKLGIEHRPVLQYKTKKIFNDTIQLIIPYSEVPLNLKNYEFEICAECNAKKYTPKIKGFFAGFDGKTPDFQILKSKEYFGSGGQAFQRIFITKEVLNNLKNLGVKPNIVPVE